MHIHPLGAIIAAALIATLFAGCSQKSTQGAGFGLNGSEGPVTPGTPREFSVKVGDTVYFDSDSVQLSADAQQTLMAQAQWLPQYADAVPAARDA